jgi:putative ABC transport system permease protein
MRAKGYALINVGGLCLGLACAMLILLFVKDELSYDRFHPNESRIYRIVSGSLGEGGIPQMDSNTGYFQGPKFTAGVPGIETFVRVMGGSGDLKWGREIKSQELLYVDSNFFSVFRFPLLAGNARAALLDPHSVVVSEDLAKKQFGTQDALGKIISIKTQDQFVPYTVTGVSKRCPLNSSIKFDLLLPLRVSREDEESNLNWFSFFLNTFVVLRPHAEVKTVEARIKSVYESDAKEAIKTIREKYGGKALMFYALQPLTDMHLNKDLPAQNGLFDASNSMYSLLLSAIALFILLIACINFVNLMLGRSMKRAKEIGVRKVAGSSRRQLVLQFMGESLILCLIAFCLAIGLVQMLLPLFNSLSNKSLSISYLLDWKLVAEFVGLFLATGILAGFYPALVLSNYNPVQTLTNRFRLAGKNYLQKSLVVLQFVMASFLIMSTWIISRQFDYLTKQKLGYDDSSLVTINKGNLKRTEARLFEQELLKDKDIQGVAPKNQDFWYTVAKVNGDSILSFCYMTVNESFLPLLHIPIVKGRNFSSEFPSDSTNSVLVNEAFVAKAGWKNPIGQQVNFWTRKNKEVYTVVGIVKDYHFQPLDSKIGPELFTMKAGNDYGSVYIKIRPTSETSSLAYIKKTFTGLFPLSPYTYHFKDEENRQHFEAESKWKQIMLFGALLTIFVSCIGLFGLSVLSAERRTKEIGIRKVMGASVSAVVRLLSSDFIRLVLISLLVTIPAAYLAANDWLDHYAYHTKLNAWIFAGASVLVIAIALSVVSVQAIRTAVANPVKSLRTE